MKGNGIKLLLSLVIIGIGYFSSVFLTFANTPGQGPSAPTLQPNNGPTPHVGSNANTECDPGPGGFWNQNLCNAPGVPTVSNSVYDQADFSNGANGGGKQALLAVKNVINRVLGLLALIALIILIYTGILMLVNARDSKKLEEGYTTVKNVAIALVFIGVSRLIVSFIFWAIGIFTGTP